MADGQGSQRADRGDAGADATGQHDKNFFTGEPNADVGEDSAGQPVEGDVERATAAPPGRHEATESFSGEETLDGVAEELLDKPT